ncbi:MAG TPA: addiction module protein [Pirellulales bacterium]|jgi:putative addiction module component (TIGR02574 family)|nr:addiction module protein [Pirellulales bacterium]
MPHSTHDFDFSQLSAAQRILLAQSLWDSVEHDAQALPFSAEQRAEIQRRLDELDAGRMPTSSWEQVKQRLRDRK